MKKNASKKNGTKGTTKARGASQVRQHRRFSSATVTVANEILVATRRARSFTLLDVLPGNGIEVETVRRVVQTFVRRGVVSPIAEARDGWRLYEVTDRKALAKIADSKPV